MTKQKHVVVVNHKEYPNGTVVETLRSARKLLIDVGWIKGQFKRYDSGWRLYTGFCALGALQAIDGDHEVQAVEKLAALVPNADVVEFNDTQSDRRAVLALFTRAINKALRKPAKKVRRRT